MDIVKEIKIKTTLKAMAKTIGIPYGTFLQKSSGVIKFKDSEIEAIKKSLDGINQTKQEYKAIVSEACKSMVEEMVEKYTLVDVAKKIGIDYNTLCAKRNGRLRFTEYDLERIRKVYGKDG